MVDSNLNSVLPNLLGIPLPQAVEGALERILGIGDIRNVYHRLITTGAQPIAEKLLQFLEVEYAAPEHDIDHIPRKGPAVMVVNHPFGVLEGAVLATLLSRVRSDVKFLANGTLTVMPEVRELVIPVDPIDHASVNPGGLRKAMRFVEHGGLLVVFPAGEVSHFQWKQRGVTDPRWSATIGRMLEMVGRRAPELAVIPAYVDGANSVLFQLAGLLHPRLRTALLARELLNKRRARVDVRAGSAVPISKILAIPSHQEQIDYLRWRCYLLAERNRFEARTNLPLQRRAGKRSAPAPIAAEPSRASLMAEVARLTPERLLDRSGSMVVYLAPADEIPAVLAEIGRLREITFRAAGEGTGNAADLDEFDRHYLHLFVWSEKHGEVVGAYRLAGTDSVCDLYTATLFQYGEAFLDKTGPALELGRSFIRPQYQKSFSALLLLWKGIGKFVARNPRYKVLFGAVSISAQYQSISRRLMVSFLERHALLNDWTGLVRVRNPFRARAAEKLPQAVHDIDELASVVSDIEPGRAGVPILLRQYLKLGGKLLGFNLDPKFSGVLDGLILVDLTKTEPRLLDRYLGAREAASFLAYQRGRNGT